ncbi:sodium-dependent transporter [Nocardioidaceae bacterium SCSIO 66511]|nr:sodium-dependent transporter [Nocardioidaceae bacterium SCSIO 66511]
MTASTDGIPAEEKKRGAFSSRRVFILAAIGSAVGLGNIWRFPYVAYDNGGGAFMIPYIVALLTAGLPFLMLDYGLGHRNRGSAPLSFARISRKGEPLGWWQVAICFVIAIYYAAIIGWAAVYAIFSIDKSWGSDPATYFSADFLEGGDPGISMDFVSGLLIPLVLVWVVLLVIMAMGVQKGIGMLSVIFIPVLVVAFVALVVQALFLDGAGEGLNALFTPDWGALKNTEVWIAAYGQIFFSLSVGFGIMITYSAYVDRRENMTGSGLVVGFANSGFELLAGIGVFAALGFIASSTGGDPGEAAQDGGIGLAFIAFPTIINEAPAGALLGVLFFVSLVIAGITSLMSVIEVVIASVRDKFELPRIAAVLVVGVPAAVASILLFSTTTSLYSLDIIDNFINQFGILLVAVVSMLALAWGFRVVPALAEHLNRNGSLKLGFVWRGLVSVITPAALIWVLVDQFRKNLETTYGDGDYPDWMVNTLGWGVAGGVIVVGLLATLVPWRRQTSLEVPAEAPIEQPKEDA